MQTFAIDIETYSSYELMKTGVYKYVESPDFEILMIAYSFNGEQPKMLDWTSYDMALFTVKLKDPSVLKTAFNANFEITCLAKYLGIDLDASQWECTMVKAAMLGLPFSLDKVAQILKLTGKDKRGKALINYFSKPCKPTAANDYRKRNLPEHAPEKWQEFIDYCKQDVVVEQAIQKKTSFFSIPATERLLWSLDQTINSTGIEVNPILIQNAIKIDKEHHEKMVIEAKELTGLDNPNSPTQLKNWINANVEPQLQITTLRKEGIPTLLGKTQVEKVKKVLQLRQKMSKTSVKKYAAMLHGVCEDTRVRGLLQFYGANRTGRWSGRLVQVQNLPKNNIDYLDLARNVIINGDHDTADMLFPSIPDTLSQLVRTAFVAPPGHRFIIADFSAIEARVIAWLAGERWRMEVFKTHGKIYEASASQMFKIPIEQVTKDIRAKGKISELALGYQGGVGAMVKMGALKMGLTEEELPAIIAKWRQANRKIQQYWYDCQEAALHAVSTGERVSLSHGTSFQMDKGILFLQLPSKRKLAYLRPKIHEGAYGPFITYEGLNQTTKQWGEIQAYGGKFVENCLSADTDILTSKGVIKITEVTPDTLLWDGIEWVKSNGVINKGVQKTISVNGVRMTPYHKILTNENWKTASSVSGLSRAEVQLPDSYSLQRLKREKINLGSSVYLRQHKDSGYLGFKEKLILRLRSKRKSKQKKYYPRYEQTSSVCRMEINGRPMLSPYTPSMAQLRCERHKRLLGMGRRFHELLERHGSYVQKKAIHRKDRCKWQLQQGKLHLGNYEMSKSEQAKQCIYNYSVGLNNNRRSLRTFWYRAQYDFVQASTQMPSRTFILSAGSHEPVYDIVNCGLRSRFTVLDENGHPFIVHNCCQSVARDCLAEAMIRLDNAGYKIVMHVHDEVVLEMPYGKGSIEEVNSIMGQPISWAPGLLLKAVSSESEYYKKDD